MPVIFTSAAERSALRMKINLGRTSYINDIEEERKALHEDIEIKCFYEGTTTLLIGSQTITANAGDVVVINPYEFHATIGCEGESRYHLFMVSVDYFAGNAIEEFDLRHLLLAKHNVFRTLFTQNTELYRLLMGVAEELTHKKQAYPVAIRGLMTQLFALLLRDGLQQPSTCAVKGDLLRAYQLIEPALRHIRDSYADAIAVEQLATLCQISKHYFCRVFKAVTGNPAMEYLRDYRLKVANTMLKNTDHTVGQIAEACGFEDANYFSRCYKNHYGTSPNKHRHKE